MPIISHRTDSFIELYDKTHEKVIHFLNAQSYQLLLFTGCGTLANEIMLWNFIDSTTKCLVLSCREFGDRLFAQAKHVTQHVNHLHSFDFTSLVESFFVICEKGEQFDVICVVGLETSYGITAPLKKLDALAQLYGFKILVNGISATGVLVDLFSYSNVIAVTGTSGKALAGLPRIGMLFYREEYYHKKEWGIPSFLNMDSLIFAHKNASKVRNTMSSHLLLTLYHGVISHFDFESYAVQRHLIHEKISSVFEALNFRKVIESQGALVTRWAYPKNVDIFLFHQKIESKGHHLYYQVPYLKTSQEFQFATMGNLQMQASDDFINVLTECLIFKRRKEVMLRQWKVIVPK